MVKADLTRDYYADLELPPTADAAEIKKQFKKLAFKHHPDRNPGREDQVLADFQRIQSAHEILSDVQERSRYDQQRVRSQGGFRNGYANFSGGTSSGMKGNPWSGVSSQYPPPPKAPTRARPTPPSAGAQRYTNNFKPPTTSAYQAAQNTSSGRQDTYNAFDRMHHKQPPGPSNGWSAPPKSPVGPGNTWAAPKVPPRGTPKSGQEESNAKVKEQAAKAEAERLAEAARSRSNARPGFSDYREPNSSQHRSPSRGYQPNNPGGDEPPAPRGAYSTARDKPMAPPPPPRQTPATFTTFVTPDPLQQFRRPDMPSMETRSQPYSSHGGEKFNPHGSPNVGRSKSTREGSGRSDDSKVPRTGSDSNLNSPHRARSSAQRKKPVHVQLDGSSSDDFLEMSSSKSANKSNGSAARSSEQFAKEQAAESARKQSKFEKLRQWMAENPGKEIPPDGFPADGPPLRNQPSPKLNDGVNGKTNGTNINGGASGQHSMYENFAQVPSTSSNDFKAPIFASTPAFASNPSQSSFGPRNVSQKETITKREGPKYFPASSERDGGVKLSARASSGLTDSSQILSPFETTQMNIVNHLVSSKRSGSYSQKLSTAPVTSKPDFSTRLDKQTSSRNPVELKSPKKFRKHANSVPPFDEAIAFFQHAEDAKNDANHVLPTRFSFPINKDTFTPTQPRTNGFSSSAENISTTFTPDDWHGKFAAGNDYFQPTGAIPNRDPRARSDSNLRGRSPVKARPTIDPKLQASAEFGRPTESPGGTKFSAEEWNETFKAQTFMPPSVPIVPSRPQSGRKRTMPSMRSTMGGRAAVFDDGEPPEKPLFDGPRVSSPEVLFPDLMDVDTPPAQNTVPQFVPAQTNGHVNGNVGSPKRPAASTPSPVDQEDLAVNFDDLKIKGFSLEMPIPPMPPTLPGLSEVPSHEAWESYVKRHAAYMSQWDAVSKQFLHHFVARKNQNENLEDMRWTDEQITEAYRESVKEDQAVLQRWADITKKHEKVIKEFVIMRKRMDTHAAREAAREGGDPRSRKKVR